MLSQKLSIPKGTRDFDPETVTKRNYIIQSIKTIFEKYGFQPIETPSMENLSVLTGKYGEEGEQLIFKILNSGDFVKEISLSDFELGYKKITQSISEKALRYDLTVPFARYVVMHKNQIIFPFRRYQIQPVWRADRPQKGRYREFYQCDADVIGTESLICEAEIIWMINEAMEQLGIKNHSIKINNRKILSSIVERIGMPGKETDFCVAIDKLEKTGIDSVISELKSKGFTDLAIASLFPILEIKGTPAEKLVALKKQLEKSETGSKGILEIETVLQYVEAGSATISNLEFDLTLARGLHYYTGCIFEIKANDISIGSIGGGGRYDNLTGVFGEPGLSGVGISFGIDRIFDVMQELNLFPQQFKNFATLLICCMDKSSENFCLKLLYHLRKSGINSEMYPDIVKIKKQLEYADRKKIPYALIVGTDEIQSGLLTLKNMQTGVQLRLCESELVKKINDELSHQQI
ncbi:MAG: histidine--tRNA ligase [Cytophagaceae bacterium]|nr:histidine--tRNA ligase [Cytophagaceae bacterium]MDW8455945.1 histidine--tRNA ligase [Cytophagaceae bacterium]